jgi:hypothetical protein
MNFQLKPTLQSTSEAAADEIRAALDRLTAAVLTLAMEAVNAQAGRSDGEVTDALQVKVFDAYDKGFDIGDHGRHRPDERKATITSFYVCQAAGRLLPRRSIPVPAR